MMKNIIAAFALFVVFLQGASGVEKETDMQEFEFELTDVFYPLLTKEEGAELSKRMTEGARVSIFYNDEVDLTYKTEYWAKNASLAVLFGKVFPKSKKIEYAYWEKPYGVEVKDGKLRIKIQSIDKSEDADEYRIKGSIGMKRIGIYLPIHSMTRILDEKLRSGSENAGYLFFDIYARKSKDSELHNKGYIYAASENLAPIQNDKAEIHNPTTSRDSRGFYGMKFHATGKLSLVKEGKTVLADDKPPPVSTITKMNSISSGIEIGTDDMIAMNKIKGLPENLADIQARYLNRKRFAQFALFGNARQGDAILAGVFINQIKTHGKLYRIDALVNDHNIRYYNGLDGIGVDEAEAACIFGFGIKFYENGDVRYFSEPKDDNHMTRDRFFVNSLEYAIDHNIKNGDMTPILAYEKHLAAYLENKPNGKEKAEACKALLSYAKHILAASKETLEKEFDEQYEIIGAAYEAERKRFEGVYVGEKKDGKAHGEGSIHYPDGSKFTGEFKDGKPGNGTMFYPNGNKLGDGRLTLSDQLTCRGKFKDGKMKYGEISYNDKNGNEFEYEGWLKNGIVAGGERSYTRIRTKVFSSIHIAGYRYNEEQKKYVSAFKNGRLEGKTKVSVWDDRHKFIGHYIATFKDGKITQHDGMREDVLKTLEEWLEKFYLVKCDVNDTIGDKS
jgi:hypothetical protein